MAVPKQRHTKSRRNRRRAHIFLKAPHLVKCKKCGAYLLPHTVCSNCGYFQGREVVNVLEKLTKKERKKREKDMKEKKQEKEPGQRKPLSLRGLSKKS